MPSTRRASSRATLALHGAQRQPADVLAVADQNIEGVELHLVIVPARVQPVEIGAAVDAEQHGLAVEDER